MSEQLVQVRGRRVAHLFASGLCLLAATLGLGLWARSTGAAATGELGLDMLMSRHRTPVATVVALAINVGFGLTLAPLVLVAVAALVGKAVGWKTGLIIVVVTGTGWLSTEVGKLVVGRARPAPSTVHALVLETAADSYPSGHTAFAAGLLASAVLIAMVAGRAVLRTLLLGAPIVALVGASRLYLGVHYLADVVGSCLVVAASTLLLVGIYRTVHHPRDDTPGTSVSAEPTSVDLDGVDTETA